LVLAVDEATDFMNSLSVREPPMPGPPSLLISKRAQIIIISLIAAGFAIGGFEAGRYTVDAATVGNNTAAIPRQPPSEVVSRKDALVERQQDRITIRDIATVPFSELYDVLKCASREQLIAWARDLDHMPRGPRQRAAINAYYKSLVQVDHRAAIEAVLHSENLLMREIALEALTKAAPESIWADLAEMMAVLPYPKRGNVREDIIWNWSLVDPVAAAQFITTHPRTGEDRRLYSLLCSWGRINPEQAREWVEADPSRQTEDAFRALVTHWAYEDPEAAINYALANASRPVFAKAINELAYDFVRTSENDASRLMLLLPRDQAKEAMQSIAHMTMDLILGLPDDYLKPADAVARWMVTLPVDLWSDALGPVAGKWLDRDPAAATQWFDQLPADKRDAALASFCRAGDSPSRVLALGPMISDRKLRDAVLGQFARSLGETREEALQALEALEIEAAQKTYLRQVMAEDENGR
jgi:hypothetical protein